MSQALIVSSTLGESSPSRTLSLLLPIAIGVSGMLFCIAGVLKIASTFRPSGSAIGMLGEFALPIGLIELSMGVVILSLFRDSRIAVPLGLLFAGLFGFVGLRWWLGLADCGCFGVVSIPPIWTASLDFSLVVILLGTSYGIGLIRRGGMLLGAAVGISCLGALLSWTDLHFAEKCVVPPEHLILTKVEASADIERILVYDPNCAKCAFSTELVPTQGSKIVPISEVRFVGNVVTISSDSTLGCHVILDGPVLLKVKSGTITEVDSVKLNDLPYGFDLASNRHQGESTIGGQLTENRGKDK